MDGVIGPTGNAESSSSQASFANIVVPSITITPQDIQSAYDFNEPVTPDASCTPVLCKIQGEAAAACGTYQIANNTNVTQFTMDVPNSKLVFGTDTGAVVAIAYNSTTKTALISWRGTSTTQDWLEVRAIRLSHAGAQRCIACTPPSSSVGPN